MSANNPHKTFKARLNTAVKNTEDFDAPAPPKPPPPQVPYAFARDLPHNPFGFTWLELVPDLAVLEGHLARGSDTTGLRLVSRMEIFLGRRISRGFMTCFPIPVMQHNYPVIRVDNRRRFVSASTPESIDYAYITTAPYPEWLADETRRNAALAELTLIEAGI